MVSLREAIDLKEVRGDSPPLVRSFGVEPLGRLGVFTLKGEPIVTHFSSPLPRRNEKLGCIESGGSVFV